MISKKTAIIQIATIIIADIMIFWMFGMVIDNNSGKYNLMDVLFVPSIIFLALGIFGVRFTLWQYNYKEEEGE